MAILTSPRLAFMLFILGPVIVSILVIVIKKTYSAFTSVQKRIDRLNSVMLENLAGSVAVWEGGLQGSYNYRPRRPCR